MPPADARKNDAGLAWVVVKEPSGTALPSAGEYVTLDYTGWNAKGEVIDSTAKHPDLRVFALSSLFPGLQQTLSMMKAGEKRRVWIPETLTPKKAPLVFDVELLEISRPFDAPPDVAAPPADAERSKSGLAWKVLKTSPETEHPKATSTVVVDYTGWTTDGRMFDSSVRTGQAAVLGMDAVIPGWQEGLKLMVPGERRRFWVPAKLAYRGDRKMPQGMLVFDVELVRIVPPPVKRR
jgi:FKBP-type peptidyl-prolyl cis-trans isomerase